MGLFDKIKKGIEEATKFAQMDDFLIKEIDRIISSEWTKLEERKPLSIAGISLEGEAEYNFHSGFQIMLKSPDTGFKLKNEDELRRIIRELMEQALA